MNQALAALAIGPELFGVLGEQVQAHRAPARAKPALLLKCSKRSPLSLETISVPPGKPPNNSNHSHSATNTNLKDTPHPQRCHCWRFLHHFQVRSSVCHAYKRTARHSTSGREENISQQWTMSNWEQGRVCNVHQDCVDEQVLTQNL